MPPAIQSCRRVPLWWLNRPNGPRITAGMPGCTAPGELGGVIAQCLDGEGQEVVIGTAGDGERVPVPAVDGLQVEHGELAGREGGRAAERRQRDFGDPSASLVYLGNLVVVERYEVPGEQFAIEVERQAGAADGDITPPQHLGVGEWRAVEQAMGETGRHEQPGKPVYGKIGR